MIRILFFFLTLLFFQTTFAQDKKFQGKWIGCGYWVMNYYKIKKSKKVMWYSNGCTDRGTKHKGIWSNHGDTITLIFENRQIKYVYKESTMCYYSEDGKHGEVSNGITKTNRFTVFGAINMCRKERKRVYD